MGILSPPEESACAASPNGCFHRWHTTLRTPNRLAPDSRRARDPGRFSESGRCSAHTQIEGQDHGMVDDPFRYDARLAGEIEARWQRRWAEDGTVASPNPAGPLAAGVEDMAGRNPCYVLGMFAYPRGIRLP